jgi:hypothetical protein
LGLFCIHHVPTRVNEVFFPHLFLAYILITHKEAER